MLPLSATPHKTFRNWLDFSYPQHRTKKCRSLNDIQPRATQKKEFCKSVQGKSVFP